MAPLAVVLATKNRHKMQELSLLFAQAGVSQIALRTTDQHAEIEGLSPAPDPDESGATFEENARIKAVAVAEWAGGRFGVLADDSGIGCDALDGAPGVNAARFAFDEWPAGTQHGSKAADLANYQKLLRWFKAHPNASRKAAYHCVLVLLGAEQRGERSALIARGQCDGEIIDEPRGDGGFGYDPICLIAELGCTFAQATAQMKAAVSHRARAAVALAAQIKQL